MALQNALTHTIAATDRLRLCLPVLLRSNGATAPHPVVRDAFTVYPVTPNTAQQMAAGRVSTRILTNDSTRRLFL